MCPLWTESCLSSLRRHVMFRFATNRCVGRAHALADLIRVLLT